ncbi:sialidase [Sporosarcina sp. Sa2YVA2]|uniref:Sialidase n=2 Tax=Sporosarcina quadrami TaxID=2762234 RepID=A0ABR8U4P3_9BACL|nr:sialidase [Sporosarcina quadrami]
MKKFKIVAGLISIVALMVACSKESTSYSFEAVKNNKFEHIHGLGYINGGPKIALSTHDGLYEYGNDQWKEANSEKHDYMGFQAVRKGFYSSGHPEEGSDLKNPLGLIMSTDRGGSFEKLAFYGEIDFHYLAAGYESNVIYVLNETPTNELSGGLHYTLDEGISWNTVPMNGFNSDFVSNLSAHPSKKEMLAIGSKDGIFLSNDSGENFELLNDSKAVLYVFMTENGGMYSSYANENVELKSFNFDDGQEKEIRLPHKQMSPISFIAVNPDNEKEIVIATHTNDIYLTKDEGANWSMLAEKGTLKK